MSGRVWKYFKVDMIRSRVQIYLLAFLLALAISLMGGEGMSVFASSYMFFMAIVLSGQIFLHEKRAECGFCNMLPGTTGERVGGRFLYSLVLTLAAAVLGALVYFIAGTIRGGESVSLEMAVWIEGTGMGTALLFCILQNVLHYWVGREVSQAVLTVIRLAPAFLYFFGIQFLAIALEAGFPEMIVLLNRYGYLTATVFHAAGFLSIIPGVLLSEKILLKRDYE